MHENKRVQNFIKSIHERCKDLSGKSTDEKMEIINNGIEEIKDFKEELKDDQFFSDDEKIIIISLLDPLFIGLIQTKRQATLNLNLNHIVQKEKN